LGPSDVFADSSFQKCAESKATNSTVPKKASFNGRAFSIFVESEEGGDDGDGEEARMMATRWKIGIFDFLVDHIRGRVRS
jgi:hypothetical protein